MLPTASSIRLTLACVTLLGCLPCSPVGADAAEEQYTTRNVIVAIMDGVPYTTTFGDPGHEYIPHLWNDLVPQGTLYTNFFNNGVTITRAGHSNIMTGTWQYNRNGGALQTRPTVIDYMADEIGLRAKEAWVIFGKGDYAYHPSTSFPQYRGAYEPGFAIAIGEERYADNYLVLDKVREVMQQDHPRLMLVNFGLSDHTAHSGRWEIHTGAVKNTDAVLFALWNSIQQDPNYRDRTTLIITTDHGYMDIGVHEGFAEHGDASEGSRHIWLLMLGPDIRRDQVISIPAYHNDIAPTIGELLGFQTPLATGEVLRGALVSFKNRNGKEPRTERARSAVEAERVAAADVLSQLADGAVRKHEKSLRALEPSLDTTMLMWGMLSAHDKKPNPRWPAFVRAWRAAWSDGAASSPHVAFVDAQLAYRTRDPAERAAMLAGLLPATRSMFEGLESGADTVAPGDREFLLTLMLGAAVAEIGRDESLWHRAADLFAAHVRRVDEAKLLKEVTAPVGDGTRESNYDSSQERLQGAGKVLPANLHAAAGAHDAWYLLAAAFIRGCGLPYKSENLSDLPFFRAEILHRSALLLEQLAFTGDLWPDALDSAIAVAAITEGKRRVSIDGDIYEAADSLQQTELVAARPESADALLEIDDVRRLIRTRLQRTNYNVRYGYPRYLDIDFSSDLLRLRVAEATDDLTVGAFLLALGAERKIRSDSFVPSPR
ncbi:MAG: sulfatase-like hydrolase/transferase [Steroidobacteraceae bacterium]